MKDKISVIVPVYNVEKYLNECVDSILNQTYQDLEIILVDDESPDNCGVICDEYALKDTRVKVIHKQNGGSSSARNVGIENATGKYLTFIDSDDWVNETFIEKLYFGLVEHDADICFCKKVDAYCDMFINTKENALKNTRDNKMIFDDFQKNIFTLSATSDDRVMASVWRILYKKSLIDKYSFRFNTDMVLCEDMLFLFSCLQVVDKFYVIDEHLYYYRQHGASFLNKYKENYYFDQTNFYKNIIPFIKDELLKKQIGFQVINALFMQELRVAKKYNRKKIKAIYKCELYKDYKIKILKTAKEKNKRDILQFILVKCRVPSIMWLIFHIKDKIARG